MSNEESKTFLSILDRGLYYTTVKKSIDNIAVKVLKGEKPKNAYFDTGVSVITKEKL